jgi:dienelactone hydrolase
MKPVAIGYPERYPQKWVRESESGNIRLLLLKSLQLSTPFVYKIIILRILNMRTLIALISCIVLLQLCVPAGAQPQGNIMDLVNTTLPLEGATPAAPGPYKVVSEGTFGSPGHILFRPADLRPFPEKDTLPVLVWGNGGCAIDSTQYKGFLTTIASHGILVLATAPVAGQAQRQANADDLLAAIDWVETENARAGSPLNGKIHTSKIAVMGQSCGGMLAITLGADPRVDTIGVFNAGVQPPAAKAASKTAPKAANTPSPTTDALVHLHGPVLLINGGERDFLMKASAADFELINHVPVFYGSRHNAGHTATITHPGGGEFANVASDWLLYQFKHDSKAARMFEGKDCGLCTNPNWDTDSKDIR